MSVPTRAGSGRKQRVSPARTIAYGVLRRTFEDGAWTDRAFRAAAERAKVEGRDRAQAQRLSYGAVQMRGTVDHVIAALAGRPVDALDPPLRAAMRLGTYELLFADAAAAHATVNECVELSKAAGRGPSRLANAVLRRVAGEGKALLASLTDDSPAAAAVKHSHPEWIARMWWDELGADGARSMLAADNVATETALRVTGGQAARTRIVERFEADGARVVARPLPGTEAAELIVIDGPIGAVGAAQIESGELVPQSRASAAVVGLLDPQPGERVLDLCAGPGIKTSQIAGRILELTGAESSTTGQAGEVVAVEIDSRRAAEARELCERVGAANVSFLVADATEAELGSGYDRVLVDPPCSGLGTLAQHPDARWRRLPEDPERLGRLQGRILRRALSATRQGGVLAYATCTISRREGEDVVSSELRSGDGRDFEPVDLGSAHPELASRHDPRFLQTRPDRDGTSGFFIALLRRRRATS